MMDFIKEALKQETKEMKVQSQYIKEAQKLHGARSYAFINDYYYSRQEKQGYIEENIFA
jgi:hypothetical protein